LHEEPTNSQFVEYTIMLLLHVSTQLFLPQGARIWYVAKLHKYVNAVFDNTI